MLLSRRKALSGIVGIGVSGPAWGQALPNPFVVYDDALLNGWQNWSWAKVELSASVGAVKPIKVEGDPWSALALHHDPFSTQTFTKLTFYVNGGVDGGQALAIKAMTAGKPIESDYLIQPKARTWAVVEVPLKEIGAENLLIDGVCWQGQAAAYPAYFITKIQFE